MTELDDRQESVSIPQNIVDFGIALAIVGIVGAYAAWRWPREPAPRRGKRSCLTRGCNALAIVVDGNRLICEGVPQHENLI